MCNTPSGEWWCTIMSDGGSAGRIISLVPITWDDGFPLINMVVARATGGQKASEKCRSESEKKL